tara:strand:- start:5404 stop:6450 length:1047 start_codon:yes stop_codon:yes gene_type:complete
MNKFVLFVFLSFIFCQDLLDRLIVPIYYQINFSTGYDSNILLFSERDIELKEIGDNSLGKIKYYDSDYYRPTFKIIYSPVLLNEYETNFIFNFQNKFYRTFNQKNTFSTNSKFEIKFGSYHWLKFGYNFSPKNYLRRYQDLDVFGGKYFDCLYSYSRGYISYSIPITKKTWTRVTWKISNYYYNEHFTEFDTQYNEFNLYFSNKWNKNVRYSLNLGIGEGNNISYGDGLLSTGHNRSFQTGNIKISRSRYNIKVLKLDKFHISFSTDFRNYLSEAIDDPLHSGRFHYDYQIYTSITKKLNSNYSLNLFIKQRKRNTISGYDWVQDLKSFNKFEVGMKFTYNGIYDIYR